MLKVELKILRRANPSLFFLRVVKKLHPELPSFELHDNVTELFPGYWLSVYSYAWNSVWLPGVYIDSAANGCVLYAKTAWRDVGGFEVSPEKALADFL